MTADEIRESPLGEGETGLLRELVAQLAEQNQHIRDDRAQRKLWRDEDKAANKKRDEVFAGLATTQADMAKTMTPPAQLRPPVEPVGEPRHLACIVRDEEKVLLATSDGPVVLDEIDAARILALISKPPTEAKPS